MGCCGCSNRVTIIFAGVFCLIEAAIWLILSIIGMMLYNCDMEVTVSPSHPETFVYLVYFYNGRCAPEPLTFGTLLPTMPTTPSNFTFPTDSTIPTIPTWPESAEPSDRTSEWMEAYIAMSAIWAFCSLILIGAGFTSPNKFTLFLHSPWILVTLGTCIMDIVAAVTYGIDIGKTNSFDDLLVFIGFSNWKELKGEYNVPSLDIGPVSIIPSVVLTLFSARFVVLWLVNFCLLICATRSTIQLTKEYKKPGRPSQQPTGYLNPNFRNDLPTVTERVEPAKPSYLLASTAGYQENVTKFQNPPSKQNNQAPHPEHLQMHQMNNLRQIHDNRYSSDSNDRYSAPFSYEKGAKETSFNQEPKRPAPPNNLRQLHENRYSSDSSDRYYSAPYSYDKGAQESSIKQEPKRPAPPVPLKPAIKNTSKYESVDSAIDGNDPYLNTGGRTEGSQHRSEDQNWNRNQPAKRTSQNYAGLPPDELRNQMPWSYFQPRDEPLPSKILDIFDFDEEDELPPVPVPDYTLHFPKKKTNSLLSRTSSMTSESQMPEPRLPVRRYRAPEPPVHDGPIVLPRLTNRDPLSANRSRHEGLF